jgi:hypothetical protein
MSLRVSDSIDSGRKCLSGIVDVGRVDERATRANEKQAPGPSTLDDASSELRIPRPPDEMRTKNEHAKIISIRGKHFSLSDSFTPGVVTASILRIRGHCICTDQRTTRVRNRRAGNIYESMHATGLSSGDNRSRPRDIDIEVITPRSDDIYFCGSMHDSIAALHDSRERILITDIDPRLFNTESAQFDGEFASLRGHNGVPLRKKGTHRGSTYDACRARDQNPVTHGDPAAL